MRPNQLLASMWWTASDFLDWWLAELGSMLRQVLQRKTSAQLLLEKDGARFSRDVTGAGPLPPAERLDFAKLLQEDGNRGANVDILLGRSMYLERRLAPVALTRRRAADMAALDIASATPFPQDDIVCFLERNPEAGKPCRYFVIKKTSILPLMSGIQRFSLTVGRFEIQSERGAIEVMPARRYRPLFSRSGHWTSFSKLLLAVCLLAGIGTFAHAEWRYQNAAGALDDEIGKLEADAKIAREALAQRNSELEKIKRVVQQRQQTVPTLSVISELTRVVPDDAWVTDLSIDDGKLIFSGFAKSATDLIPRLEASPLFQESAFSAPVTKVPGFDDERFTISAEVEHVR